MRRSPYKIISWYQLGMVWCKSREYVVNQRNIMYNYIYIHTYIYIYLRIGWFNLIRYQKLLVLWLQRPGVAIPRPYVDAAVSLVLACLPWCSCSLQWPHWENVKVLHLQDDPKIHAQSEKKHMIHSSWSDWVALLLQVDLEIFEESMPFQQVQDLCVHLYTLRTFLLPAADPSTRQLANGHFDGHKPKSSTQVAAPNFHLYCLDLGKRREKGYIDIVRNVSYI